MHPEIQSYIKMFADEYVEAMKAHNAGRFYRRVLSSNRVSKNDLYFFAAVRGARTFSADRTSELNEDRERYSGQPHSQEYTENFAYGLVAEIFRMTPNRAVEKYRSIGKILYDIQHPPKRRNYRHPNKKDRY